MSFKSKLKVSGHEFNILNVNYGLIQETDATGRPSSIARGGKIEVSVESTGETTLFELMTNNFERQDGSIVYTKRDSDATLKELLFEEAYVVKYKENFDATGENPFIETIVLSAKKITMGTGEHVNEWV
ncbi:type VI secretion system tube protein TssD [Rapidithrix thailandica]|uniref:Type VI secretion system tube protein TssD n=1 Tax=Rapidithrix thailandica TaxID=413964 RepID=A0AAW9S437_9BACT